MSTTRERFIIEDDRGHQPTLIEAQLGRFGNGALALRFNIAEGLEAGQPWLKANVNLPEANLAEDEIAIPGWGEHSGLAQLLLRWQFISGEPIRHVPSGHVQVPIYKIGMALQRMLSLEKLAEADRNLWIIVHTHEYGQTAYIARSATEPTEEQAIAVVNSRGGPYEEAKGEVIYVHEAGAVMDIEPPEPKASRARVQA